MYEIINKTHVDNEEKLVKLNTIANLDPRFVYRIKKGAHWRRELGMSTEDQKKLKIHDNLMKSRNQNVIRTKKSHFKVET